MSATNPVDSIRLGEFSVDELHDLENRIAREIKRRSASKKKEVLSKIKALASSSGYSLDELLAQDDKPAKVASRAGTVQPKYRNPANASITWTGRGKRPKWVNEALAAGKSLEDLSIRS